MKRYIFLAGAPLEASLNWGEDVLLNSYVAAFDEQSHGLASDTDIQASVRTAPPAKWRLLQPHNIGSRNISEASQLDFFNSEDDNADFLEHSIAVLDDLQSSQIIGTALTNEREGESDLESTFVSFHTTNLDDASFETSVHSGHCGKSTSIHAQLSQVRVVGGITDLKSLPKADYISRIQPQTMSVNVLVGIISISQPRTVRLKQRKAEMDVVELIVGDDTKAGFTITFWLTTASAPQRDTDDLRDVLQTLRPGQVTVLQNVALSSFRGNVYGQSLSKRFAKNSTTISLLDDSTTMGHTGTAASKLHRVFDWTSDFVGIGNIASMHRSENVDTARRRQDERPPDTQE